MSELQSQDRLSIINQWSAWIANLESKPIDQQIRYGVLITLMFDHIPGRFNRQWSVMKDEAHRVYSTFLPHVVRNPRSARGREQAPIWIFAPDYPVKKLDSGSGRALLKEVTINDGLHLSGPMLIPVHSRLKIPARAHFDPNGSWYRQYIRPGFPLRRIHVQPVDATPRRLADYTFKTVKWRLPDLDLVEILPKSKSEL